MVAVLYTEMWMHEASSYDTASLDTQGALTPFAFPFAQEQATNPKRHKYPNKHTVHLLKICSWLFFCM